MVLFAVLFVLKQTKRQRSIIIVSSNWNRTSRNLTIAVDSLVVCLYVQSPGSLLSNKNRSMSVSPAGQGRRMLASNQSPWAHAVRCGLSCPFCREYRGHRSLRFCCDTFQSHIDTQHRVRSAILPPSRPRPFAAIFCRLSFPQRKRPGDFGGRAHLRQGRHTNGRAIDERGRRGRHRGEVRSPSRLCASTVIRAKIAVNTRWYFGAHAWRCLLYTVPRVMVHFVTRRHHAKRVAE